MKLTFLLHQVFERLPFHVVWDIADKDSVSLGGISIGLEAAATPTALRGPLFPGFVVGLAIHLTGKNINKMGN